MVGLEAKGTNGGLIWVRKRGSLTSKNQSEKNTEGEIRGFKRRRGKTN